MTWLERSKDLAHHKSAGAGPQNSRAKVSLAGLIRGDRKAH